METTRRSLLRGVSLGAGYLALAPFLERLRAAEQDSHRAPKRIVFVLQSNGFHPWGAQPRNLERTEAGPSEVVDLFLDDYELSEDMAPLRPHRWRTTVIQRMHGEHCRPYHSAMFGALQGIQCSRRAPTAETIDARLARMHPATFPLVNLGVNNDLRDRDNNRSGLYACSSAWGPGQPIATQLNPNLAYKALFGPAAEKIDEGGGLLDGIRNDVKRVEAELNAEERERLAEHLDAFESLDERRKLFQQAGGGAIDAAAATTFDERYQSSLETQRLEAQFELAAAALITGLTNTVTIVSGACDTNGHFEGLGFDEAHLHNIGHFQDFSSEFTWREVYTRMRQFHFRLIADLVDRLSRASDERGSSLMDDTLIVYTSDGAETHHSRGTEWPFVLIGNWGGKLRSGRFLEYPASGQAGSRVINALYCTLLHAAGAEAESFNLPREEFPDHMGPLRELLA